MSRRLHVLVPEDLDLRLQQAVERARISKGEWVRRAIESSLRMTATPRTANPVERLEALEAPTGDLDQVLRGIERVDLGGG